MAKTIANCTMWLDHLAIASQVNQVSIEHSAAELDVTTFANAGQARIAGLRDGVISAAGLWESNPDPDFTLFADVGALLPVTVALARNAPEGTVAYLMCSELSKYGGIGAKVGNPLAFSLQCGQSESQVGSAPINNGRLAQGVLALSRTTTAASGTSAIIGPLPAPTLGQGVVWAAHVVALSAGATLNFSLNSSATSGMGSPTTRATSGPYTAVGSDIIEIAGPITDTYWQVSWTLTGSSPSATIAVSLGNCY